MPRLYAHCMLVVPAQRAAVACRDVTSHHHLAWYATSVALPLTNRSSRCRNGILCRLSGSDPSLKPEIICMIDYDIFIISNLWEDRAAEITVEKAHSLVTRSLCSHCQRRNPHHSELLRRYGYGGPRGTKPTLAQNGPCGLNDEGYTLIKTTLANPTSPSSEIPLIPPHTFSVISRFGDLPIDSEPTIVPMPIARSLLSTMLIWQLRSATRRRSPHSLLATIKP
ncbi:hypothetical protein AX14_005996 [Amanita brunnescens Koide BX004]|nr:hypothetical protein AX14_005996 [Amanita brunnescens Koide BX004]